MTFDGELSNLLNLTFSSGEQSLDATNQIQQLIRQNPQEFAINLCEFIKFKVTKIFIYFDSSGFPASLETAYEEQCDLALTMSAIIHLKNEIIPNVWPSRMPSTVIFDQSIISRDILSSKILKMIREFLLEAAKDSEKRIQRGATLQNYTKKQSIFKLLTVCLAQICYYEFTSSSLDFTDGIDKLLNYLFSQQCFYTFYAVIKALSGKRLGSALFQFRKFSSHFLPLLIEQYINTDSHLETTALSTFAPPLVLLKGIHVFLSRTALFFLEQLAHMWTASLSSPTTSSSSESLHHSKTTKSEVASHVSRQTLLLRTVLHLVKLYENSDDVSFSSSSLSSSSSSSLSSCLEQLQRVQPFLVEFIRSTFEQVLRNPEANQTTASATNQKRHTHQERRRLAEKMALLRTGLRLLLHVLSRCHSDLIPTLSTHLLPTLLELPLLTLQQSDDVTSDSNNSNTATTLLRHTIVQTALYAENLREMLFLIAVCLPSTTPTQTVISDTSKVLTQFLLNKSEFVWSILSVDPNVIGGRNGEPNPDAASEDDDDEAGETEEDAAEHGRHEVNGNGNGQSEEAGDTRRRDLLEKMRLMECWLMSAALAPASQSEQLNSSGHDNKSSQLKSLIGEVIRAAPSIQHHLKLWLDWLVKSANQLRSEYSALHLIGNQMLTIFARLSTQETQCVWEVLLNRESHTHQSAVLIDLWLLNSHPDRSLSTSLGKLYLAAAFTLFPLLAFACCATKLSSSLSQPDENQQQIFQTDLLPLWNRLIQTFLVLQPLLLISTNSSSSSNLNSQSNSEQHHQQQQQNQLIQQQQRYGWSQRVTCMAILFDPCCIAQQAVVAAQQSRHVEALAAHIRKPLPEFASECVLHVIAGIFRGDEKLAQHTLFSQMDQQQFVQFVQLCSAAPPTAHAYSAADGTASNTATIVS